MQTNRGGSHGQDSQSFHGPWPHFLQQWHPCVTPYLFYVKMGSTDNICARTGLIQTRFKIEPAMHRNTFLPGLFLSFVQFAAGQQGLYGQKWNSIYGRMKHCSTVIRFLQMWNCPLHIWSCSVTLWLNEVACSSFSDIFLKRPFAASAFSAANFLNTAQVPCFCFLQSQNVAFSSTPTASPPFCIHVFLN